MRTRLISLLFLLSTGCLFPVVAVSAPKGEANADAMSISDDQVVRYLTTGEVIRWEQAHNLKREGLSDIESGEWLKNRRESALGVKIDSARSRQVGEERVRQGQQKIEQAEAQLEELRAKAQANYREITTIKVQEYNLTIPLSSWDDFSDNSVRALLNTLWSKGYARLYFAGSYFYASEDEYRRVEPVDINLRGVLLSLDDRYSVLFSDEFQLGLELDGERHKLTFPDQESVLRSFQPAAIILQLVPLDEYGVVIASIRGIDLSNGSIVANETVLLSDIQLEDWLREVDTTRLQGEKVGLGATAMDVQMADQAEFTSRVQRQKERFLFNVLYRDETTSAATEAQLVAFKALISSIVDGCVSDTDFLFSIEQSEEDEKEEPSTLLLNSENAVWLLSPKDTESNHVEDSLELLARSLRTNTDIEVGLLRCSMQLPQAAEEANSSEK